MNDSNPTELLRRQRIATAARKRWAERYDELRAKVQVVAKHQERATAVTRHPIGARRLDPDGYIWIKVAATGKKWMYEHRWIMSRLLGRVLLSSEDVHHIDENRANNDPSNLELLTKAEHNVRHGVMARHNQERKYWSAAARQAIFSKISKSNKGRRLR